MGAGEAAVDKKPSYITACTFQLVAFLARAKYTPLENHRVSSSPPTIGLLYSPRFFHFAPRGEALIDSRVAAPPVNQLLAGEARRRRSRLRLCRAAPGVQRGNLYTRRRRAGSARLSKSTQTAVFATAELNDERGAA